MGCTESGGKMVSQFITHHDALENFQPCWVLAFRSLRVSGQNNFICCNSLYSLYI